MANRRYRAASGKHWALIALSLNLALGCTSDSTNPWIEQTRAPADLNIMQLEEPPALVTDSVGFWAVKGKLRAIEMFFADSQGQPADRLLRFEVGGSSLAKFPDGHKFGSNDSVFITIRITDPATFAFDFEPSGLLFKGDRPAKLTVAYGRGTASGAPESELGIWMQEQVNGVYTLLESRVDTILQEVEADVPGFSRYAIAY